MIAFTGLVLITGGRRGRHPRPKARAGLLLTAATVGLVLFGVLTFVSIVKRASPDPPVETRAASAVRAIPTYIDFKATRVEVPSGSRNILLHFERDSNYGLALEVSQDLTMAPDRSGPDMSHPGFRDHQQKTWIGLKSNPKLGWQLPGEFTEAEVKAAAREVEQRARRMGHLPEGAMPEFAHVRHRDGWTYHLVARVLREPGSAYLPAPEGALFTVDQPVLMPADALVRLQMQEKYKDGITRPVDQPVVFKTAPDRATGIFLRWHVYGDRRTGEPTELYLDVADPDTGMVFHRFENGIPFGSKVTAPGPRPLPEINDPVRLTDPGRTTSVHLLHSEGITAPGTPITDWRDWYVEVHHIDSAKEQTVPAFRMPSLRDPDL